MPFRLFKITILNNLEVAHDTNLVYTTMKHLSYSEFTKLMENKGETSVVTNENVYTFTGISEHTVCVQIAFKLIEEYQIGETGFYVKFDRVVTLTEAQCMYMSLKLTKVVK